MTMMRPAAEIAPGARNTEAAPGVERIDVDAVASQTARTVYASRQTWDT